MQNHENFYELIEQYRPLIKEVSVTQVKQMFNNKTTFILIDVRQDNEWVKGKIEDAIHLSLDSLMIKIKDEVPDMNLELVIYCAAGYRSVLATFNLQQMGYTKVSSMSGGISAWSNQGYKIII